ncbi:hypothetical protein M1563_03880 [Patescibacteria group bacterium]|nr:hypothetical protein [Patescibacteria group bacterium]
MNRTEIRVGDVFSLPSDQDGSLERKVVVVTQSGPGYQNCNVWTAFNPNKISLLQGGSYLNEELQDAVYLGRVARQVVIEAFVNGAKDMLGDLAQPLIDKFADSLHKSWQDLPARDSQPL